MKLDRDTQDPKNRENKPSCSHQNIVISVSIKLEVESMGKVCVTVLGVTSYTTVIEDDKPSLIPVSGGR